MARDAWRLSSRPERTIPKRIYLAPNSFLVYPRGRSNEREVGQVIKVFNIRALQTMGVGLPDLGD